MRLGRELAVASEQEIQRGLTIPSSGPAYGGPLKSNVRRHKRPKIVQTCVEPAR